MMAEEVPKRLHCWSKCSEQKGAPHLQSGHQALAIKALGYDPIHPLTAQSNLSGIQPSSTSV